MGIGSCDSGGLDVPQSMVWKLESQENQWCQSGRVQLSGNQESRWCKSWSESESTRTRSTDIWGQGRWVSQLSQRRQICSSSALYSTQDLNRWHDAHPHWEGLWFYCLLTQMLLSPRDTFTDTPRNDVLPAVQACFSPVKLTYSHHKKALSFLCDWGRVFHEHVFAGNGYTYARMHRFLNSLEFINLICPIMYFMRRWTIWHSEISGSPLYYGGNSGYKWKIVISK